MAQEWYRIALVCVIVAVATGMPHIPVDEPSSDVVLMDAAEDSKDLPQHNARSANQDKSDYPNPAGAEADHQRDEQHEIESRMSSVDAVSAAAAHAKKLAIKEKPTSFDWKVMAVHSEELTKADKVVANLTSEKGMLRRFNNSKLPVDPPGQWANLLSASRKMDAEEEDATTADDTFMRKQNKQAREEEVQRAKAIENPPPAPPPGLKQTYKQKVEEQKDFHRVQMKVNKQYRFDHTADAKIESSPSYQSMSERGQKMKEQELQLKAKETNYKRMKKGQKPLKIPKPGAKMTDAQKTKQLMVDAKKHEKEAHLFKEQYKRYDAQFGEDMRTDFQHVKPVVVTTTPQSERLYEYYKKEQAKPIDITYDANKLKAIQARQDMDLQVSLNHSQAMSPTPQTIAELLVKRAAGSEQLAKDSKLAQKLSTLPGPPISLKKALRKDTISEVNKWQADKLLKEGQGSVVKDAQKLAETGSRADLSILDADIERVKAGRPTMASAEKDQTRVNAQDDDQLEKMLGPEKYQNFLHQVNHSMIRMGKRLDATKQTADAISPVNLVGGGIPPLPDDSMLPDSIDDPVMDQSTEINFNGQVWSPYAAIVQQQSPDMDEETDPRWVGLEYQDLDPVDADTPTADDGGTSAIEENEDNSESKE